MDDIDKTLSELTSQIGQFDTSSSLSSSSSSSFMKNNIYKYSKKYLFYWSLFLFLFILFFIIKPEYIYETEPNTNKKKIKWSKFCILFLIVYSSILLLYYLQYYMNHN